MLSRSVGRPGYFPSIDVLKGLAIISVILLHTITDKLLKFTLYPFHIYQAVPVFMVLAGLTLMFTFGNADPKSFKSYYNLKYFNKKILRLVYPFLIILIISLLYGLWDRSYYLGILSIAGYLPVTGPGNYYISLLLEFIIIAPFIAYFYRKNPGLLLASMVLIDLGFQLIAPHIGLFSGDSYIYRACILRYFSAIALGLLISDEFSREGHIDLMNKRYRPVLLMLPISILYISIGMFVGQPFPLFKPEWGTQNILSFPYALILAVLVLNLDISRYNSKMANKVIIPIGKASYHIFLVQILFFGFGLSFVNYVTKDNLLLVGGIAILLNLLSAIVLGLIFYRIEPKITFFIDRNVKTIFNRILGRASLIRLVRSR